MSWPLAASAVASHLSSLSQPQPRRSNNHQQQSPLTSNQSQHSSSNAMSSANNGTSNASGSTGGSGSSAFGRMFRRYSQTNSKSDAQRSSRERDPVRDRTSDRDAFTSMTRNTSSPSLGRESTSLAPVRSPTAGSSQPFPRPASTTSNLVDRSSGELAATALPALPDITEPQPPIQPSSNLVPESTTETVAMPTSSTAARPANNVHRIRLVPHLEATRSLHFEPIERDVKEGAIAVKIGRFTDRQPSQQDANSFTLAGAPASAEGTSSAVIDSAQSNRGQPGARGGAIPFSGSNGGGGRIDSSRIAFKSKVVSRGHSELWCEPGGKFFIRDTKSSSGTFLNHIRLSAPNAESRPFAIKDGDVIQLGVDYQGGTEEIYRCVKMRVELNRGWQREANQFNVNALRQLRALQGSPLTPEETGKSSSILPTNRQGVSVTDCCICLFSVTVCQALFIAPCSHVFHYKCIRPLLNLHHPGFSCPLCRTFADLDADVEEDEAWQVALLQEAAAAEARVAQGQAPFEVGTPAVELDAPIIAASSSPGLDALNSTRISVDTSTKATNIPRSTSGLATSPILADLHASGPTFASIGRGTAASIQRKNDWAGRSGTAVGTSIGQTAGGDDPVADDINTALLDTQAGDLTIADGLMEGVPSNQSWHASGPIAIGGARTSQAHLGGSSTGLLHSAPVSNHQEDDWPTVAPNEGFSPTPDENGTPLNSTFLSTLAEAPRSNTVSAQPSRDFPPGRSAPAKAIAPNAHDGLGAPNTSRLVHTSDGGDDVDTADEEHSGSSRSDDANNDNVAGKGKTKLTQADHPNVTLTQDIKEPPYQELAPPSATLES